MPKLTFGLLAGLGCLLTVTPVYSAETKTGMDRVKEAQTGFRVCATPNNLPFTNKAGDGFDNKIAELIASKEGKPLSYAWAEPSHAFFRQTLGAWDCDVVMSVPAGFGGPVVTTKPYYCSKYVELRRRSSKPAEAEGRIGVVVKTPPLDILLRRHRDPHVYLPNDPKGPDYMGRIGSDLIEGRIDAAYLWGPLAARFVKEAPDKLEISATDIGSSDRDARIVFPIAMGVRHGDDARLERLNALISSDEDQIKHILEDYGVPFAEGSQCTPPKQDALQAPTPPASPAVFAPLAPFSRDIVKVADTRVADTAAAKGVEPEAGGAQGAHDIQCKTPETLEEIAKIDEGSLKIAKPVYTVKDGKVGPRTYSGWIRFSLNCERCHGPGGVGSAIAPDLSQAVKGLNYRQFQTILTCGLVGNIGAGVMPSWKDNPNVMPYVENLWAYLKARADGALPPGRPEKTASSQ